MLWDKFSHKGNKSLIALLDFIFNTGEYIILVCHAQKVVDQMFSRVSVHIARKSPPTLPHPPGFGKRGTTPCERYNTFKISGFTDRWGIRQRFRLLATADPITTISSKKTLEWPVEEAPTVAVPAMQVLCELTRNLKKQSTVIHFRHTLFYIFKS